MKRLLFPLLAILFLISCGKESTTELQPEIEQNISENVSATARSSNKRNICHNGKIKNVSINAIPDHQAHGDAVDMDEDGFFDFECDCGTLVDCDDTNPAINPEADEVCDDGIDNNCNGEINEGCFSFPTIVLNGRTWTAENLNIDVPGSVCYDNDPDNCITYGRMYNFEDAQTACEALGTGWRVPTRSEWDAMILSFGGFGSAPSSAYDELIDGGSSGFNLLFGGEEYLNNFGEIEIRGRYWSSTTSSSSNFAWQYQLITFNNGVFSTDNLKVSKRSCRCILD